MIVSDFIDYLKVPYTIEILNQRYDIKMNFLEYAKITSSMKDHLDWRDIPDCVDFRQRKNIS